MATGKLNIHALQGGSIGHGAITTPAGLEQSTLKALYDASTPEEVLIAITLDDYASGLTILIPWSMKGTNTGNVVIHVSVWKIENGDLTETPNLDTANSTGAVAVPGTIDDQKFTSLALTNDGSPAGAEVTFLIIVKRKADDGSDTATGDMGIGPGPFLLSWTTT